MADDTKAIAVGEKKVPKRGVVEKQGKMDSPSFWALGLIEDKKVFSCWKSKSKKLFQGPQGFALPNEVDCSHCACLQRLP